MVMICIHISVSVYTHTHTHARIHREREREREREKERGRDFVTITTQEFPPLLIKPSIQCICYAPILIPHHFCYYSVRVLPKFAPRRHVSVDSYEAVNT